MLPKTARSAQTHKSMSFIWIVWSTLYVYLCLKAGFFLCVFEADKTKNEFDKKVSNYQKYTWVKEFSHLINLLNALFDFHIKMQLSLMKKNHLLTIKKPKTQI